MDYAKDDSQVYVTDLQNMNGTVGSLHRISKTDSGEAIMNGHFDYRRHSGGLSVHSSEAVELQNLSNSAELPPGLSLNFLFEGHVDFSLGGRQYCLGEHLHNGVECSALILTHPEILTRHMKQGVRVCKVNIFVERDWLEQRCENEEQKQQLQKVFYGHSVQHHWKGSAVVIELANKLMKQKSCHGLSGNLYTEHLAIELLSASIEELCKALVDISPEQKSMFSRNNENKLKKLVDEKLTRDYSLQDIADSLSVSISTLQRKFKGAYGITVIDYVRQRRLEAAKSALTIDGLSIGEAAYLAGYNHPSNFVAAFKKRFSMTPAALVKSHRR